MKNLKLLEYILATWYQSVVKIVLSQTNFTPYLGKEIESDKN